MPVVSAQLSQYTLYLDPNCLSVCKGWLQQPHYPCSFCPTVSVHAQFRFQLSLYTLYLDPNCLSTFKVWLQQPIIPVFFANLSQYTLYLDPNCLSMCKVWLQRPYYPCSFCPTVSVHALFTSQLSQYVESLDPAASLSL